MVYVTGGESEFVDNTPAPLDVVNRKLVVYLNECKTNESRINITKFSSNNFSLLENFLLHAVSVFYLFVVAHCSGDGVFIFCVVDNSIIKL